MLISNIDRFIKKLAVFGFFWFCALCYITSVFDEFEDSFLNDSNLMNIFYFCMCLLALVLNFVVHFGFYKKKKWGFFLYGLWWTVMSISFITFDDLFHSPKWYLMMLPFLFVSSLFFVAIAWHNSIRCKFFPDVSSSEFVLKFLAVCQYPMAVSFGLTAVAVTIQSIYFIAKGAPLPVLQISAFIGVSVLFTLLFWKLAGGLARYKKWAYVVCSLFLLFIASGYAMNFFLFFKGYFISSFNFMNVVVASFYIMLLGILFFWFSPFCLRLFFKGKELAEIKEGCDGDVKYSAIVGNADKYNVNILKMVALGILVVIGLYYYIAIANKGNVSSGPYSLFKSKRDVNRKIVKEQKPVNIDPDSALGCLESGKSLYDQKKYISAIEKFDKAISLNNNFSEAYYSRALAYFAINEYSQPLKDINQALELYPEYRDALEFRIKMNLKQGNVEQVRKDFVVLSRIKLGLSVPKIENLDKKKIELSKPTKILSNSLNSQQIDPSDWKRMSFNKATSGKLRAINLEFIVPENYVSSYSQRGTIWGVQKDVENVSKNIKEDWAMFYCEKPLFHFFYSMNVGYFSDVGKFSEEKFFFRGKI